MSNSNDANFPSEYVIGRPYHTSWAKSRGFVWVLVAYDQEKDEAHLITPKTRKGLKTQLSSLRDVNKTIFKKHQSK